MWRSRLGTLNFTDGVPDAATAQKLFDELDYVHAVTAFINGYAAVNQLALLKGFRAAGVNDNEVLVTSGLMDAKCLFLTANADTYYMWAYLDLSKGPLVVETPPDTLGIIDDMWWNWVSDFGFPGADRGLGGKYLLLPPGYSGDVPEGGFYVRKSRTNHVAFLGRAFLQNNDPKPVDEMVKRTLKIYPYEPGGEGSSIASYLKGQGRLGALSKPTSPTFVEGTGRVVNTIPPSDFTFWEMLNEAVQAQPAEAMDPEIAGQIAAIGIVKGKPFAPDARMKRILSEALAVGNAARRAMSRTARPSEGFGYYGADSRWVNGLFVGGYEFLTPPPEITKDGLKPIPVTARANSMPGSGSSIRSPGSRRRCACGSRTSARSISRPSRTPMATPSTAARPTRSRFRPIFLRRGSGHSPSMTTRRARCSTRRSVIRAPAARAIRHPPPNPTPMGRRRCTSDPRSRRASHVATGSRRCPIEAGGRSFASTARSSRSSTRAGAGRDRIGQVSEVV